MKQTINVSDFRNNFADYINRIIYNKAEYTLVKGRNYIKISLVPHTAKPKISPLLKLAGLWSDEDVEEFKRGRQLIERQNKIDEKKMLDKLR